MNIDKAFDDWFRKVNGPRPSDPVKEKNWCLEQNLAYSAFCAGARLAETLEKKNELNSLNR